MKEQLEVKFDKPEPFSLAIQSTEDGDRAIQERAQRETDRALSEQQQTKLTV